MDLFRHNQFLNTIGRNCCYPIKQLSCQLEFYFQPVILDSIPNDAILRRRLVNTGSGNDMLPGSTKPLLESVLTNN